MSPDQRDTPQIVPSSWPERLPMPCAVSNVSQKAAGPPSCMPQLVEPVVGSGAAHIAVVPPLEPAQLHENGPEPVTGDAVPAEQRLAVGAVAVAMPFADPHAPL